VKKKTMQVIVDLNRRIPFFYNKIEQIT